MCRRIATCAKIVHGADEPFAKKICPDMVDRNARHQLVLAVHQPARKVEPISWSTVIDVGQRGWSAGDDLILGLFEFTAMQQMRDAGIVGSLGNHANVDHRRFRCWLFQFRPGFFCFRVLSPKKIQKSLCLFSIAPAGFDGQNLDDLRGDAVVGRLSRAGGDAEASNGA